ncbi:unnamed protein product [Gemmata massiliana]|uniref:Uncharacterized protein n=1 Tax=Gemmata massiliana TaxID=1210884 RepID=A0A6P2CWJ2_9BACT|nr:hypothetical protein [Gemmata massiliana]VTR93508.1 unnamed protein product [Gemmata massiliana]
MGAAKPRKAVVLRPGMTHAEARAAVAAAWPGLTLTFWKNLPGYYHEGRSYKEAATAPADVFAKVGRFFVGRPPPFAPPRPSGAVRITGAITFDRMCDLVYATFDVLPEIDYALYEHRGVKDGKDHTTLARVYAEAEKQRKAFVAKHGREPVPADAVSGDGWGFGSIGW